MNEIIKLPPQALDVEKVVLGALMLDRSAYDLVINILTAKMFYSEIHGFIFTAIQNLASERKPIDIMTVSAQLESDGYLMACGGRMAIMEFTTRVNSAANIETHSMIIKEKFIKRELIAIGQRLQVRGYEDTTDVFELQEEVEKRLFELFKQKGGKEEKHIFELYTQQIKRIEAKKDGEIEGILTGLRSLDNILQGVKKQNVIILAARPSMGKTALALTIAKNIATDQKIPVAVFSLEMSMRELCNRHTSLLSSIPLSYIKNSNVRGVMFDKMMTDLPRVKESQLFIDDEGGITIMQFRAKVRKLVKKHAIEIVIIDYLQLIKPEKPKGSTNAEITEVSNGIKQIAKEFDIPIIALAQLSRDVEKRGGDKRPVLSDLRDGGAIEQDADIVGFLYRPDYYQITTDENNAPLQEGFTEIIIRKNRDGDLGTANVRIVKDYTRFEDLQMYEERDFHTYDVDITNKEMGESERLF